MVENTVHDTYKSSNQSMQSANTMHSTYKYSSIWISPFGGGKESDKSVTKHRSLAISTWPSQ